MQVRSSLAGALALWVCCCPAQTPKTGLDAAYTQDRNPSGPWSINVVRVPRRAGMFELHSVHGAGHAVGLGTVSEQVAALTLNASIPIVAINGDFYQRQGPYMGNPRGLQI